MYRIKHINIALVLVFTLISFVSVAQSTKKLVRQGNSQYEERNFSEAEVQYRKALTDNPNYYKGKFNLGDAMYEQENYEESGKIFNELAERQLDPEQKSGVYYNMGNSLMSEQKYQEAIEAYKNSLRLNPNDVEAKYNLEYARKKLQDQQQQQQNQDQDKDKQDQQDQDQNKDDQQKDQDQKEQEQDDQKKQNQDQEKNDKSDQQQQQPQPQQISKEDAQKMLDALKNDEKNTLQELQKQKAKAVKGKKSEIDW